MLKYFKCCFLSGDWEGVGVGEGVYCTTKSQEIIYIQSNCNRFADYVLKLFPVTHFILARLFCLDRY